MTHPDLENLLDYIAICEFFCLLLHFMIVGQNMKIWFFLTIPHKSILWKKKINFKKIKNLLPGRTWSQYVSQTIYLQTSKKFHVNRVCLYRLFQKAIRQVSGLSIFQLFLLCGTRTKVWAVPDRHSSEQQASFFRDKKHLTCRQF